MGFNAEAKRRHVCYTQWVGVGGFPWVDWVSKSASNPTQTVTLKDVKTSDRKLAPLRETLTYFNGAFENKNFLNKSNPRA